MSLKMKDASSRNNLISSDEENENIDGNQVWACGQLIVNCKYAVCGGLRRSLSVRCIIVRWAVVIRVWVLKMYFMEQKVFKIIFLGPRT